MYKSAPLCKVFKRGDDEVVVMRVMSDIGAVVELSFEDENRFMRQLIQPSAPGQAGLLAAFDSIEEDFAFACRDLALAEIGPDGNEFDQIKAEHAFRQLIDNTPALNLVEDPAS